MGVLTLNSLLAIVICVVLLALVASAIAFCVINIKYGKPKHSHRKQSERQQVIFRYVVFLGTLLGLSVGFLLSKSTQQQNSQAGPVRHFFCYSSASPSGGWCGTSLVTVKI